MDMRDLLLLASMAIHFGSTVWSWLEKRNDKTNERLEQMQSQLDTVEKDVHGLKEAQRTAPSHNDLGKVYESINQLSATVNQLVGENRSQTDSLRLILKRLTGAHND